MMAVLESTVSVNTRMVNLRQLWKDTVIHRKISKLVIYRQSGTAIEKYAVNFSCLGGQFCTDPSLPFSASYCSKLLSCFELLVTCNEKTASFSLHVCASACACDGC